MTTQQDPEIVRFSKFIGALDPWLSFPLARLPELCVSRSSFFFAAHHSLRRFGRFYLKFYRPHNSFAFFHHDQLVRLHILQGVNRAAWPADFEQLHLLRFSDTKMNAQIILRNVTAATAYLVNLLVRLRFARRMRNATQAGADAAAVRFCSDRFYLQPIIFKSRIAAQ